MSVVEQRATSRFERWTSGLFLILAVLGAVAVVWFVLAGRVTSDVLFAGVAVPVGIAGLSITAWGLAHRLAWARWAAVRILWVLIALGAIRFILSLTSSVDIPIEAIVGALILVTTRPDERAAVVAGRDRSIATALVVAVVVANLWWIVVALATGIDPFR